MTPAEICLARMLIAWDEWPGAFSAGEGRSEEFAEDFALSFGDMARDAGLCLGRAGLTDKGAALVARYREHMAATRDAKAIGTINGVP